MPPQPPGGRLGRAPLLDPWGASGCQLHLLGTLPSRGPLGQLAVPASPSVRGAPTFAAAVNGPDPPVTPSGSPQPPASPRRPLLSSRSWQPADAPTCLAALLSHRQSLPSAPSAPLTHLPSFSEAGLHSPTVPPYFFAERRVLPGNSDLIPSKRWYLASFFLSPQKTDTDSFLASVPILASVQLLCVCVSTGAG